MRYLSFGAGVNTTALLLLYPEVYYDEVIFADTGAELPKTYEYIDEYVKPFLKDIGIKFTVVRGNEKGMSSLEEYCIYYKIVPSMQVRWCTEKFKLDPIAKYLKKTKKGDEYPIIALLGITYEEKDRIKESPYLWQVNEYPLVQRKLTRQDSIRIIRSYGWSVPPRSGCFFCPFQSSVQLRFLYLHYPELYERAIRLEENSQQFPKFTLLPNGISLRVLRNRFGYGNHRLEEYA